LVFTSGQVGSTFNKKLKITIDIFDFNVYNIIVSKDTENVRRTPERGIRKGSTNFCRTPERGIRKGSKITPRRLAHCANGGVLF
jgi:hypothetical protein